MHVDHDAGRVVQRRTRTGVLWASPTLTEKTASKSPITFVWRTSSRRHFTLTASSASDLRVDVVAIGGEST